MWNLWTSYLGHQMNITWISRGHHVVCVSQRWPQLIEEFETGNDLHLHPTLPTVNMAIRESNIRKRIAMNDIIRWVWLVWWWNYLQIQHSGCILRRSHITTTLSGFIVMVRNEKKIRNYKSPKQGIPSVVIKYRCSTSLHHGQNQPARIPHCAWLL